MLGNKEGMIMSACVMTFFSRFKACLGLVLLVATVAVSAEAPKDLDIYLLIGQSNMAGRAPITPELDKVIDGVYLLDKEGAWVDARPPLNIFSTIRKGEKMQKLNPGVSFAQAMRKKYPDKKIGLVVNAKGGSSIKEWYSTKAHFYKEALRRIKEAQKSGTLRAILWHQGETDCKDPRYIKYITSLIQNFRTDLGMPTLPFIAGQINGDYPFNKLILRLPHNVPVTGVVRSAGLKAMDQWHFDTPSVLTLGQRYADKLLQVGADTRIIIDATKAQLQEPMQVVDGGGAGKYVVSTAGNKGTLTAKFDIAKDGKYCLWLLGRGIDGTKDSFFYSVDGAPKDVIDLKPSKGIVWHKLAGRKNKSHIQEFKKGEHKITISGREAQAQLQMLMVEAVED